MATLTNNPKAMSELEKVYNKHYVLDFHSGENIMSFNQFKSALNEVLKLVEVTDEEILNNSIDLDEAVGAYKIRELSKTKLEKLIG